MASEAQMIMTLSMKKIVESRGRRGGASLRRNLLVAGVLFKARDVLLTAESAVDDEPPPSDDAEDRWKCREEDEAMDCERTGACDVGPASSGGKENVPPDQRRGSDDVQPPTAKPRSGKRASRDLADDDVTPCKATRADTSDLDDGLTDAEPVVMDVDDDDDVFTPVVDDAPCRQTGVSSASSCPAVAVSSVARWSNAVSRLPCLDGRIAVDQPPLVRPLLVVQVV